VPARRYDAPRLHASATHVANLNGIFKGALTQRQKFPVLLGRVLSSGTHCGDHLTVREVEKLSDELEQLKTARVSATGFSGEERGLVASAIKELRRVVRAALAVDKAIAF